jgi:TDG/mug DNA glycosylase family protein
MQKKITPTKEQLLAAEGKTIRDVIAPGLKVLFCGVNPGLYSGATGHHFARPGNRFWIALFQAGFTPRPLSPYEDASMLKFGCGITNLVARTTRKAEEITREELASGRKILEAKITQYRPKILAVLGMGAYRKAFDRPKAGIGLQPETIGATTIWVLPNPSGLNANYQIADLTKLFAELRTP